jgi:putative membrane protein
VFLSEAEARAIDARIQQFETRTGAQVVTAVLGKCDSYPELVWKAFAMAAVLCAFAVAIVDTYWPAWVGTYAALSNVAPVLLAGAASALAAVFVPDYARLFLRATRRDAEVRQRAHVLFLDRGLTATKARNGVLLLVSLFERKVEIVSDLAYQGRVERSDWDGVIAAMTPSLASGKPAQALLAGLDTLETMLRNRGYNAGGGTNELPDRPIEEAGS